MIVLLHLPTLLIEAVVLHHSLFFISKVWALNGSDTYACVYVGFKVRHVILIYTDTSVIQTLKQIVSACLCPSHNFTCAAKRSMLKYSKYRQVDLVQNTFTL